MKPKHGPGRAGVFTENGPLGRQIRAVITLPRTAVISGLSMSVASVHKHGGGEFGSILRGKRWRLG